jgi:hypothetical protein
MRDAKPFVRLDPSKHDEEVFIAFFGEAPSRSLDGMVLCFSSGGRPCELPLERIREIVAGIKLVPLPATESSRGWIGAVVIRGEALGVRQVPGASGGDFRCFLRIAAGNRDYVIGADGLPRVRSGTREFASLVPWIEGRE